MSGLASRNWLRAVVLAALLATVFAADTATDFEIAAPVFYVAVVLLAVRWLPTYGVVALSALCIALTIMSFAFTRSGAHTAGLINGGISISAIVLVTYLGIRMLDAEAATHVARAQLTRIARVSSLGVLTTSIAHEVNQPLTAVVTSGEAALRWLGQDPPNLDKARRAIERANSDANRASDVIVRIRGLAKGEPPHKSWVDLNDAVVEAVGLAQAEINRNDVTLRMNLADDLPLVLADKIQVQQVIGNLVLNALEAMQGASSPTLNLVVSTVRTPSDEALVAVADSGVGLPQDALEQLFDACWTTKKGGIGMGLTISRSIVEAHDGRIWAIPNSPSGAIFQFTLPAGSEVST